MSSEVEYGIGSPDVIEIGVVSDKTVMWGGGFAKEQAHGVAFITKGGLYAYKDVSILLTVNEQVLSIRVQMSGGGSPLLDNAIDIGSIGFIFGNRHLIGNIQFRAANHGFRVVQNV